MAEARDSAWAPELARKGLRAGTLLSAVLIASGLAAERAGVGSARAVLTAGIWVLAATPAARVLALAVGYVLRREWLFAGASVLVLVLLAASLF